LLDTRRKQQQIEHREYIADKIHKNRRKWGTKHSFTKSIAQLNQEVGSSGQ
jgi:hypothetical protein